LIRSAVALSKEQRLPETFQGRQGEIAMSIRWTALLACLVAAVPGFGQEKKRVLMVTKSSAFQHDVVARGKSGELGLAEKTVKDLCDRLGYELVVTKDASQLNAENLKTFKGLFFYTQGDLTVSGRDGQTPMKKEDRAAILEFVKNGGGFVGTHCGGADTFNHGFWVENGKKPFIQMVGAEFTGHGPNQDATVEVVDPNFPAVSHWPRSFRKWDEWYAYDGFHENVHVLMMLKTEGMKGHDYERPEYPITWCSNYGDGRVFYTGLGHVEKMWEDDDYKKMLAGAIKWTLKDVEGDASPNLKSLFGDEKAALKRFNQQGPKPKPPAKK
jgi:type 1 glutamine amidotransferase